MIRKRQDIIQIGKYLIIGGTAFVTEYAVFYVLMQYFFPANFLLVAQTASFCVGLAISFLGNRFFTFSSNDSQYAKSRNSQLIQYCCLAAFNLLLSNILIYSFVTIMGLEKEIAKIAVMIFVVGWNFIIFQKIIFKNK